MRNITTLRKRKIKIILLGESGHGKTQFLKCAAGEPFDSPVTSTVSFS